MNATDPYFSIIIPAYNVSAFIAECINSVLSQLDQRFEIIIIDDGSTDETAAIADGYAQQDPRIKVLRKQNGGQSSARNLGIRSARGIYVYFLDADDYILDTTLSMLSNFIAARDIDVVYFGGHSFLDPDPNHVLDRLPRLNINESLSGSDFMVLSYPKSLFYAHPPLCLIRRDFLIQSGIDFTEGFIYEDEEFSYRLAIAAKSVISLNQFLFVYRIRGNSTTQGHYSIKNVKGYLNSAAGVRRLMLEPNLSKAALSVLASRSRALYVAAFRIAKQLQQNQSEALSLCMAYRKEYFNDCRYPLIGKFLFYIYSILKGK